MRSGACKMFVLIGWLYCACSGVVTDNEKLKRQIKKAFPKMIRWLVLGWGYYCGINRSIPLYYGGNVLN